MYCHAHWDISFGSSSPTDDIQAGLVHQTAHSSHIQVRALGRLQSCMAIDSKLPMQVDLYPQTTFTPLQAPPEMLNLLSPDILKICTDMIIHSGYIPKAGFGYIYWLRIFNISGGEGVN